MTFHLFHARREMVYLLRLMALILIAEVLAPMAVFAWAQDVPVVSVVATASAANADISVAVTNNRSVPLEAWAIELAFDTTTARDQRGGFQFDYYRLDVAIGSGERTQGPIGPGETRVIKYPVRGLTDMRFAIVKAALFRDLHYEGDQAFRKAILANREMDAADVDDWLQTLDLAMRQPPSLARQQLAAKVAGRQNRAEQEKSPRAPGLDAVMQQVVESSAERFSAFLMSWDSLRGKLTQDRERALRHRKGGER